MTNTNVKFYPICAHRTNGETDKSMYGWISHDDLVTHVKGLVDKGWKPMDRDARLDVIVSYATGGCTMDAMFGQGDEILTLTTNPVGDTPRSELASRAEALNLNVSPCGAFATLNPKTNK
jgi:hypothetical protein